MFSAHHDGATIRFIQAARNASSKADNARNVVLIQMPHVRLSALVGAIFLKLSKVILPTINGKRNEMSCKNVTTLASTDVPLGNVAKQCALILIE